MKILDKQILKISLIIFKIKNNHRLYSLDTLSMKEVWGPK